MTEHHHPAAILADLNEPQAAAVRHFRGPILVLAGAGSGKTRVLTRRVANLVLEHGVAPDRILAVTFTNKATQEMRERIHHLLGDRGREVWASTFHSASLRILRRHAKKLGFTSDFAVYDDQDSKGVLKQIMKEAGIDEKKHPVGEFSRAIDQAKNSYLTPAQLRELAKGPDSKMRADIYNLYQEALLNSNAMDFGDLLMNVVRLFRKDPEVLRLYQQTIQFVLVDEFQDTNTVQYMFIRDLTAIHRNLLVVGDDDQSIYAFRGASMSHILEFEEDFPDTKVVKLEQNYRSTSNILNAAHQIIVKNTQRKEKKLWTSGAAGSKLFLYVGDDETSEAEFIAREIRNRERDGTDFGDIAIFYRTNAQSRAIEEALMHNSVPYRIYGGLKFYDRKEVKDILAYLRLLVNELDSQAFLRVINTPTRGIGPQAIRVIATRAREGDVSLFQAAFELADESKPIAKFAEVMRELKRISTTEGLSHLIREIISRTGYSTTLDVQKDASAESRIENLKELEALGASMEGSAPTPFEVLQAFLDRVSLTAGNDLPVEETRDKSKGEQPRVVSLMTLHLAKGLEFPVAFLSGMEEGLLPHYRSMDDPKGVEEERRLCYVGITRAMHVLFVTRARRRGMFSSGSGFGVSGSFREPSRFAFDLPPESIQECGTSDFFSAIDFEPYAEDIAENSRFGSKNSSTEDSEAGGKPAQPRKWRSGTSVRETFSLLTADALLGKSPPRPTPTPTRDPSLPLARPEEIQPGVKVVHPAYGSGTVENVEWDPRERREAMKVSIRFEGEPRAKKFIFKDANLALG